MILTWIYTTTLLKDDRAPNSRLDDFLQALCLVNNIPEPTCVASTTKSLINAALTSNQERFSFSGTLQFGLSDHDLIYVVRKNKLPRPKPRFVEDRSPINVLTKNCYCLISERFPGELILFMMLQTMLGLIGVPCTRIFSINTS